MHHNGMSYCKNMCTWLHPCATLRSTECTLRNVNLRPGHWIGWLYEVRICSYMAACQL